MKKIRRKNAVSLIKNSKGRIFGVDFVKKNGELRTMSARLGVSKGVKGVGRNYTPSDYNLVGVYDMNNGFRMVNLNTLKRVSFKGESYEVI